MQAETGWVKLAFSELRERKSVCIDFLLPCAYGARGK